MRPSLCPTAMSPALVVLAALVLLLASPSPSLAKRFDCQMFCRTTGFNGMVGGCRCSFTLFTAKRSPRDRNSVPEEEQISYEATQLGDGRYFSLGDLVRMSRETHGSLPVDAVSLDSTTSDQEGFDTQEMPKNHPARLLLRSNGSAATQKPLVKLGRPSSQMPLKRKEFEQDLDNGDTTDYLRLPY